MASIFIEIPNFNGNDSIGSSYSVHGNSEGLPCWIVVVLDHLALVDKLRSVVDTKERICINNN